jgi:hypothetical protein
MVTSTHIKATKCPFCAGVTDMVTDVWHDRQPQTGDLSVCLYCASVLKMEVSDLGEVTLHAPSPAELIAACGDPEVIVLVHAVRQRIAERGGQ